MKLHKLIKVLGVVGICATLGGGLLSASTAEALKIGALGGAIVNTANEQSKIRKSLEYYDDEGRYELFDMLKKSEGVNNDSRANAQLKQIMTRLTTTIAQTEPSIKEKPYNYFVNPQNTFNAFCSLGHNVSVNAGVFNFFDYHEDKVAAVVAHELVHGQRNHPLIGAKKRMSVEFVQKVVGSQLGGGERLAVDVVATHTKVSGVTKPNEWEADNIAFNYMVDSGYNPGAPAAVWQRVMDRLAGGADGGFFADVLNPSTHPKDTERRDNYAKKLTAYSNNKVVVDPKTGVIKINNQPFMSPAAAANMSGLERSYLIAGNLAAVYHNNKAGEAVSVANGVVKIGNQPIVQPMGGDAGAAELAQILSNIK